MVTVTEAYDDLFQNWLFHFKSLQLDMELYVYAEDDYIYQKYKNETHFKLERNQFVRSKGLNGQNFNQEAFNKFVNQRPYYMKTLLMKHDNVLHSDVDTVWLQDPRHYFHGDFDFFAQLDGVIDGHPYFSGYLPYFCTGFLAFRNTRSTMKLIDEWIIELEKQTQVGRLSTLPFLGVDT